MSLKSTAATAGLVALVMVMSDLFSKSMRGVGVGGWLEVVVWERVSCNSASAMDTVEAAVATCVVAVKRVCGGRGGKEQWRQLENENE